MLLSCRLAALPVSASHPNVNANTDGPQSTAAVTVIFDDV